jgi:hypothetical protein
VQRPSVLLDCPWMTKARVYEDPDIDLAEADRLCAIGCMDAGGVDVLKKTCG